MSTHPIYLDHAAATPLDADVLAAMQPYFAEEFYNPSALYLAAKQVSRAVSDARDSVAKTLGARPAEVIFTAGGTEANNLAIHGVMRQFPDGNIVVSAIEHDSILEPAKLYEHRISPVDDKGQVILASLQSLIDDNTVLVSVMYANNETGAIQPVSQIAQMIAQIRQQRSRAGNARPLYLHTDACQAANYLLLTKNMGVDMMTVNGGKLYGPKQSGCLFVRAGTSLQPQILGGGQERGMRSGTENVAATIGFAKALAHAQGIHQQESARLGALRQKFCTGLIAAIPNIVITPTPKTGVLPNFVHIQIPGVDNERLIMELDEQGIMAAAGSACSASSDEPSHVLMAMGMSKQQAQSSLRFTMGRHSTEADIEQTIRVLSELVGRVYNSADITSQL